MIDFKENKFLIFFEKTCSELQGAQMNNAGRALPAFGNRCK
jgi:hypothetical protein